MPPLSYAPRPKQVFRALTCQRMRLFLRLRHLLDISLLRSAQSSSRRFKSAKLRMDVISAFSAVYPSIFFSKSNHNWVIKNINIIK